VRPELLFADGARGLVLDFGVAHVRITPALT